ncbi:MAG: iron-containing redox enzyme family protein [Terracidiphilus sp.]
MGSVAIEAPEQNRECDRTIQATIETIIDDLMASLPAPQQLTSDERRGIIARYSTVLEGNFIYWMTATLIATESEAARPIILANLLEEVRDSHPHMMWKFALAARAIPTDKDALAVQDELTSVRLFLGRLSGVQSLATMAFFEGFIQRFMSFLASLAASEGSTEMEYTDVHGVCDIAHTEGLYRALATEMFVNPIEPEADVLEGVYLLRTLIERIIDGQPAGAGAAAASIGHAGNRRSAA